MARTAVSELQQQIEEVRREAFAAGYTAAMQAIREFTSRRAMDTGPATARRRSRGSIGRKTAAAAPTRRRRARASETAARLRRSPARRPQRGANAERVEEILKTSAPRALRMAEIRKALQEKGVEMPFTAIRKALGQLEARNAAQQVGDTKTWRHRGGAS